MMTRAAVQPAEAAAPSLGSLLAALRDDALRQQINAQWTLGLVALSPFSAGGAMLGSLHDMYFGIAAPADIPLDMALPFWLGLGLPGVLCGAFGLWMLALPWLIARRSRRQTQLGLEAGAELRAFADEEWLRLLQKRLPDLALGWAAPKLELNSLTERARFFAFHLPNLRRLLRNPEARLRGVWQDELARRTTAAFDKGLYVTSAAVALLLIPFMPFLAPVITIVALAVVTHTIRANASLAVLCEQLRDS